jgi:ankyrin repeat protein
MAHALVQAGVEVSGVAENGRTPLQLAVVKRNKAAQKLLAD